MRILVIFFCFLLSTSTSWAQDLINNQREILEQLAKERKGLLQQIKENASNSYVTLSRLLDIGEWNNIEVKINQNSNLSSLQKALLHVKYQWFNNEFETCQKLLDALPAAEKNSIEVRRWLAILDIEAWRLTEAEESTKELLKQKNDIETSLVLGRTLLLQKKYEEALLLSNTLIKEFPKDAAGYFLKADICFWDQKPKEAEEALLQGLALEPFNADARFYYGYAIWRRIDATQLDDMVGQWEIALALNPLHYQAHWHLGNGHTNLTFADYVDEHEKEIRAELQAADDLFTNNEIIGAFQKIANVKLKYKNSVLPDMHSASLLYGDFDATDRKIRLDEAEKILLGILSTKKHYGPAHNALSAVIKSKRIPILKTYHDIMENLKNPNITNLNDFLEIFPDVAYYPGDVVKGMAWNQLYTSVVYFPFLVKQHRLFVIPPLHNDLAIAMKAPYFRFNTTFDNRQWMDIRGVGSGAAAIEYVERGAFDERNVLLHEYVHLFHSQVLTDEQNRRIKALYYNAMEKGLTLDYYSQNNESEYLAQTYPAYFEKFKVHPLDFKSMNTTNDLKQKDPEMYSFLDELINKEKAYLAGDNNAMASNWAQVYLNLANNALKSSIEESNLFLDTALVYDSNYIPAHLAYAKNNISEKKFEEAGSRISIAKRINPNYAPIYTLEAELLVAASPSEIEKQATLYRKAYDLEDDFMIKAQNHLLLRNFYFKRGYLREAIEVAEEYAKDGSEISTYLRDRKTDSKSFVAWQKGLHKQKEYLNDLSNIVSQKPFNYSLRAQYIEALIANEQYTDALENLNEVYRNLNATQIQRPDFELLYLELYSATNNNMEFERMLNKFNVKDSDPSKLDAMNSLKLVDILITMDRLDLAKPYFQKIISDGSTIFKASKNIIEAKLFLLDNDEQNAFICIEKAIHLYPYHKDLTNTLSLFKDNQPKIKKLKQLIKTI